MKVDPFNATLEQGLIEQNRWRWKLPRLASTRTTEISSSSFQRLVRTCPRYFPANFRATELNSPTKSSDTPRDTLNTIISLHEEIRQENWLLDARSPFSFINFIPRSRSNTRQGREDERKRCRRDERKARVSYSETSIISFELRDKSSLGYKKHIHRRNG